MIGPELKPCPFCGAEARLRNYPAHSTAFWIGCDSDSCFGNLLWEETKAEAIAAWNSRAPVDYAALPEVQAIIAGALQSIADKARTELSAAWAADFIAQWVRNATPADALAARDAIAAEAVAKEREACAQAAHDAVTHPSAYACRDAIRKRGEG